MTNPLFHPVPGSISAGTPLSPLSRPAAAPRTFQSALVEAIREVEGARLDAQARTDQVLAGEKEELHEAILATQKAELAFEMFLQVRNKVVQAYQEVMRMQM